MECSPPSTGTDLDAPSRCLPAFRSSAPETARCGSRPFLPRRGEAAWAALARGEQVSSPLGMFRPVERTAREARNPATGEMKQVPARTVVKSFRKRGPDLREPSPLLDPTAR